MLSNFPELGAKDADIQKMVHTASYGDSLDGIISGFAKLKENAVTNIYLLMLKASSAYQRL